jgi:hypothetical protein
MRKQHVFAGERWMSVPFEKKGKVELDGLVGVVLELPAYISDRSDTTGFRDGIYGLIGILDAESGVQSELPKSNSFRGCLGAIRNAAYLICYSLLGEEEKRKEAAEEVLRALEGVDACAKNAPASSLFLTTCFAREVLRVWGPRANEMKRRGDQAGEYPRPLGGVWANGGCGGITAC